MIILLRDPYRSFLVLSDIPVLFIDVFSYDMMDFKILYIQIDNHFRKTWGPTVSDSIIAFQSCLQEIGLPCNNEDKFLVRRRRPFYLLHLFS